MPHDPLWSCAACDITFLESAAMHDYEPSLYSQDECTDDGLFFRCPGFNSPEVFEAPVGMTVADTSSSPHCITCKRHVPQSGQQCRICQSELRMFGRVREPGERVSAPLGTDGFRKSSLSNEKRRGQAERSYERAAHIGARKTCDMCGKNHQGMDIRCGDCKKKRQAEITAARQDPEIIEAMRNLAKRKKEIK